MNPKELKKSISELENKIATYKISGKADDIESFMDGLRAIGFSEGLDQMVKLVEQREHEKNWFDGPLSPDEAKRLGPKAEKIREQIAKEYPKYLSNLKKEILKCKKSAKELFVEFNKLEQEFKNSKL